MFDTSLFLGAFTSVLLDSYLPLFCGFSGKLEKDPIHILQVTKATNIGNIRQRVVGSPQINTSSSDPQLLQILKIAKTGNIFKISEHSSAADAAFPQQIFFLDFLRIVKIQIRHDPHNGKNPSLDNGLHPLSLRMGNRQFRHRKKLFCFFVYFLLVKALRLGEH